MFLVHRENSLRAGIINCLLLEFYGLVGTIIVVAVLSCAGCVGGLGQIVGSGVPSIVVHQYNYEARPPALAPGTPPSPPPIRATDLPPLPVVNYQTVYPSVLDDPTLVIFKNDSYQKKKIEIDDGQPIRLGPYAATANIYLGPGEHRVRVTTERPTKFGIFDWVEFSKLNINIELNGRSQIIHLSGN